MAHETEMPYLNRKNIEQYFESLAHEIDKAGIGVHRVLVVGGAAIALKYRMKGQPWISICAIKNRIIFINAVKRLP